MPYVEVRDRKNEGKATSPKFNDQKFYVQMSTSIYHVVPPCHLVFYQLSDVNFSEACFRGATLFRGEFEGTHLRGDVVWFRGAGEREVSVAISGIHEQRKIAEGQKKDTHFMFG